MRFRDELPPAPPPVPVPVLDPEVDPDRPPNDLHELPDALIPKPTFITPPNSYGIYHEYPDHFPTYNPLGEATLANACDSPNFTGKSLLSRLKSGVGNAIKPFFAPFLNATTYRLVSWAYSGSNEKSIAEVDRLVKDVLLADDFDREHLRKFRMAPEAARLDKPPDKSPFTAEDGWISTSINIPIPSETRITGRRASDTSEARAPEFEVKDMHYRRPLEVLKSAIREKSAEDFHLTPFKTMWKPEKGREPERLYSEVYNSDAMLREYNEIRANPPVPSCRLETVIGAIMLWSDSTHFTAFGNAVLWPIYLFIGNASKYIRSRPTSFSAHHLAYIPKVCPTFVLIIRALADC